MACVSHTDKKARLDKGKVAIIGSGLIGRCWATLFLRGGYSVVVYDVSEDQLKETLPAVREKLIILEKENLLGDGQSAEALERSISTSTSLEETVKGAVYVQECTPESVSMKQRVFADIDRHADQDAILASSTSCIMPSQFTSDLQHRTQCIVAHPVNPPHYVPLVEIIPAPWTSESVVTRTLEVMKELGQSPIQAKKEINGFILNRLQYALIMEAWRLVEDGVASPEDIDTAITDGLGLRYSFMGIFETMHVNAEGMEDYCKRYGDNITTVCESQKPARQLSGDTLSLLKEAMERKIPLEKLGERREWRERRLAALMAHKTEMKNLDNQ